MSIRTKAWLLIIIITLSVSGICGNFIFSLRRMNAIDENLKIMNQINIKLLECRRQEKNYQLRGLAVHGQDRLNSVEKWETLLATGLSLTKKAEKNLGPRYINSLNAVNREINEYKKVFQGLVKTDQNNPRSWDTFLEKKLVDRARASQTLIQKIRECSEFCVTVSVPGSASAPAEVKVRSENGPSISHVGGVDFCWSGVPGTIFSICK
ncbi:MAG: hypothetical protein HUN05_19565 [Desulfobacter sp.]|nr:MAG: hypothetical protein HUN05_19565 [Desulfobacter sp.]